MPWTHDLGRTFVHGIRYPMDGAPRFERSETMEVEPPYRVGKGVCVRWWRRRAVVIGRWGKETRTEHEALYDALRARDMDADVQEVKDWRGPPSGENDWKIIKF